MTKARLRWNVIAVIAGFMVVIGLAASAKIICKNDEFYCLIKDFSSLVIAIAAAWLAYCFQRRQSFLASLRELWGELIDAKAELIAYTHNPAPDSNSFGRAHRALSNAIDYVRAVYQNVGESEKAVGLYPFEPLHDMRRALDILGIADATAARRRVARNEIVAAWNALRWAFLREFSTPVPPFPITSRGAVDPRRLRLPLQDTASDADA